MQIYRLATRTNIATSLRCTKVTAASVFHCRLLQCVLHFRRIHNMPISGFCDRKWKDYQLCVCVCVECRPTTENRRMTAVCSKRLYASVRNCCCRNCLRIQRTDPATMSTAELVVYSRSRAWRTASVARKS